MNFKENDIIINGNKFTYLSITFDKDLITNDEIFILVNEGFYTTCETSKTISWARFI